MPSPTLPSFLFFTQFIKLWQPGKLNSVLKIIGLCITCRYVSKVSTSAPINTCLNVVVQSQLHVKMAVGPSKSPSYSRHSQIIFSPCCPLNNQRAALSLFQVSHLSLPFFACILIILLMSSNVHPNPGPIFPCSMCAEYVT